MCRPSEPSQSCCGVSKIIFILVYNLPDYTPSTTNACFSNSTTRTCCGDCELTSTLLGARNITTVNTYLSRSYSRGTHKRNVVSRKIPDTLYSFMESQKMLPSPEKGTHAQPRALAPPIDLSKDKQKACSVTQAHGALVYLLPASV